MDITSVADWLALIGFSLALILTYWVGYFIGLRRAYSSVWIYGKPEHGKSTGVSWKEKKYYDEEN